MVHLSAEQRDALPGRQFAFQAQRKEPIENAAHVRAALARFGQVEDVTDAERDVAWKRILAAAERFGVLVSHADWRA